MKEKKEVIPVWRLGAGYSIIIGSIAVIDPWFIRYGPFSIRGGLVLYIQIRLSTKLLKPWIGRRTKIVFTNLAGKTSSTRGVVSRIENHRNSASIITVRLFAPLRTAPKEIAE